MRTLRTLHVATAAVSERSKAASTRNDTQIYIYICIYMSIDRKTNIYLYIYMLIYNQLLIDHMTRKSIFVAPNNSTRECQIIQYVVFLLILFPGH